MERGSQTRASVHRMEERREKRTSNSFLYCHFITVGSWLEPTVIAPNSYWFLARTGSDMWLSTYCQLQPQTGSDVDLYYRFWPIPNHFLILKPRTDSEGSSLPVGLNPAVMMPAVIPESVVVLDVEIGRL
jgi:hypothetical protein